MTQLRRHPGKFLFFISSAFLFVASITGCKSPSINILSNYLDTTRTIQLNKYPFPYAEPVIKKFDLVRVKFAGSSKEVMELLNGNAGIQLETITKTPEGSEQIGQQVDQEGFLSYPIIGKVKAEGLTKEQLRLKLLELATPILKEPFIMVDLPKRGVSMLGEVRTPSPVLLIRERTNLLETLTQVGSVTEFADLENVKVYRENPDGSRILGHINLNDTSFLSSPFFYPLPDDVVYVPALKQKNVKYFGQTYAPLATIVLALSTLLITILR